MIKGVIFDFWGTLVENGIFPSPVKQVRYILRVRMSFQDYILRFEDVFMAKPHENLTEAFKAVCKEFELEPRDFIIEKLVGMWNKNELLGKPFLDTIEVLKYLKKKKIKVGLISNTNETINRVLDKFDLRQYFDAQVLSYEEGMLKTDPDLFKKLLKKLKLKSEQVVMIGDSIPTDIIGARKADVRPILLDRRNNRTFSPRIVSLRALQDLIEKDELDDFIAQGAAEQEKADAERQEENRAGSDE
ncbi:MAG: HAD family hydrolase [Nanoarchaeota archaeon]|nr:HAD family hydrolase [Nanoarchaeota archaeon]MBU1321014.1 HAD family hydrolase [Nanoarchaeota archaeon]MBU1597516.1 HAD family hydrolase [Nanoarchaeota archaeon]MBU2441677.1 HAD family hydrolase [Nanoarchaeota archaeon]